VAIALVIVIAFAWLRTRGWSRRTKVPASQSELLRLYERIQLRLGRRRAPPETPLEYMNGSPSAMDSLLEDVTSAVNQGAYAGRWPELTRVRELADRLS
jgi:hypothetical protein